MQPTQQLLPPIQSLPIKNASLPSANANNNSDSNNTADTAGELPFVVLSTFKAQVGTGQTAIICENPTIWSNFTQLYSVLSDNRHFKPIVEALSPSDRQSYAQQIYKLVEILYNETDTADDWEFAELAIFTLTIELVHNESSKPLDKHQVADRLVRFFDVHRDFIQVQNHLMLAKVVEQACGCDMVKLLAT